MSESEFCDNGIVLSWRSVWLLFRPLVKKFFLDDFAQQIAQRFIMCVFVYTAFFQVPIFEIQTSKWPKTSFEFSHLLGISAVELSTTRFMLTNIFSFTSGYPLYLHKG